MTWHNPFLVKFPSAARGPKVSKGDQESFGRLHWRRPCENRKRKEASHSLWKFPSAARGPKVSRATESPGRLHRRTPCEQEKQGSTFSLPSITIYFLWEVSSACGPDTFPARESTQRAPGAAKVLCGMAAPVPVAKLQCTANLARRLSRVPVRPWGPLSPSGSFTSGPFATRVFAFVENAAWRS